MSNNDGMSNANTSNGNQHNLVSIIIKLVIAIIGIIIGWIFRGKKENKIHAQNQAVIEKLNQRLIDIENKLKESTGLAQRKIIKLQNERNDILSKIESLQKKVA